MKSKPNYASYTADSWESDGISAFRNASGLRELYLGEPITFDGGGRRMFPWSQLTVLYFTQAIDLPLWVSLLKLCHHESDVAIEFAMNPVHAHLEDLLDILLDKEIHHKRCFAAVRHHYDVSFGKRLVGITTNPRGGTIRRYSFSRKARFDDRHARNTRPIEGLTLTHQPTDDDNNSEWSDVDSDPEESTIQASNFILPNLSSLMLSIAERIANEEKDFPIILKAMESILGSHTAEDLPSSCRLQKLRVTFSYPSESISLGLKSLLERYPSPRFDFEVVDLLVDTSSCIDSL
ncbi:unnamed protein product [Cyclocybe aegerita]|uniref:Uncharacterized protein n=1 Tax=Cyclocybe aegerita TaxID=1973307 RepID=A0A8S0X4B6_CYCAE|nr:unnamed protein product [Cyclocybe aegerita]